MQYRQQCRFTIKQNLRVYLSIKIFEENTRTWSYCVCVRSDQGPSVFGLWMKLCNIGNNVDSRLNRI